MMLAASFTASDGGIVAGVAVLLCISGILALAETGLVRTSKARARALEEADRRGARSLSRLVNDPEKFLSPILLLVLICQLVSATLVGVVAGHLFGALGVAVATFFEVIVIFVAAEAIPKHWAVSHSDRAALLTAPIVTTIIGFWPVNLISSLLIGLARLVIGNDPNSESEPDITESELLALADVALEEEVIEREERALISSIIEFGDTIAREIMVPRPDIVAVEQGATAGEVLERAMAAGLSRIPVFTKTVDDIVGIAYTKDLIRVARDGGEDMAVGEIAREAKYVPETKRVAMLLREMQSAQTHLAVVVDEYGGTSGIVTLEDLIEELVGEIADEFDIDEPLIEPLGAGEFRVSGRMPVDEVNDLLEANLPVGDWDTIGGLVFHIRGQVPVEGERMMAGNYVLVAERVQGRRIGKVRVISPTDHNEKRAGAPINGRAGASHSVRSDNDFQK